MIEVPTAFQADDEGSIPFTRSNDFNGLTWLCSFATKLRLWWTVEFQLFWPFPFAARILPALATASSAFLAAPDFNRRTSPVSGRWSLEASPGDNTASVPPAVASALNRLLRLSRPLHRAASTEPHWQRPCRGRPHRHGRGPLREL
jgi:hypothetical protein